MVMEAVLYGDTARRIYRLDAFMIMPNHVHVVWLPLQKLSTIMDWLKGTTARRANRILNRRGPFGQDESYDHWIRSGKEFNATIAYVERNPVRAGLVEGPEDWPWSSAGVGWEGSRQDRLPHKDHEDPREVTT
jgi:REP-associated tyrosine transposase